MSTTESRCIQRAHADVSLAEAQLSVTSIVDNPYGIYVDGGIVSCGSKDSCKKHVHWWRQTLPNKRITIRKRRSTDRVWGAA